MTLPNFISTHRSLFIGIAIGVISTAVICTAIFAYHDFKNRKNIIVNQNPISTLPPRNFTPHPSPSPYLSPTPVKLPMETINPGSITWLSQPKPIKLSILKSEPSEAQDEGIIGANYHQIASFSDGSILINAFITRSSMGDWTTVYRVVQTADNKFFIVINSGQSQDEYFLQNSFKPSVKFTEIKIDGLLVPEKITSNKGSYVATSYFMDKTISFTELKNPVLIDETQYGRLYAVYEPKPNLTEVKDRRLWLRLKDDTVKVYDVEYKFNPDDNNPMITWDDGSKNSQVFGRGFKGGCGASYGNIIKDNSTLLTNKIKTGSTSDGQLVYQIKDNNSPVVKAIYDMLDGNTRPSFSDWLNTHNHFLVKDFLGDWTIFISEQFMIQAECAKPVIYLYPTKNTQVSVKVGADITKSEPLYPQNGWTVLARPNGELFYQNQSYPYLFWEGLGQGIYPDYRNRGTLVTQHNFIPTLKSQLSKLGLNPTESADFLDFWQEKLPKTPYVRLTWLNTSDMNTLAPLSVNPRPDTIIRLFLEFEGLEKPVNLTPQKLSAPVRRGFTLVEWGGLLLGKQ